MEPRARGSGGDGVDKERVSGVARGAAAPRKCVGPVLVPIKDGELHGATPGADNHIGHGHARLFCGVHNGDGLVKTLLVRR